MGGECSLIDYEQGKIPVSPAHPEEIVRDALLEEEKKESSITDFEKGREQGKKETLEWLEKEINTELVILIRKCGDWRKNLNDSIDLGDYWVREFDLRNTIKNYFQRQKKQMGEKNE